MSNLVGEAVGTPKISNDFLHELAERKTHTLVERTDVDGEHTRYIRIKSPFNKFTSNSEMNPIFGFYEVVYFYAFVLDAVALAIWNCGHFYEDSPKPYKFSNLLDRSYVETQSASSMLLGCSNTTGTPRISNLTSIAVSSVSKLDQSSGNLPVLEFYQSYGNVREYQLLPDLVEHEDMPAFLLGMFAVIYDSGLLKNELDFEESCNIFLDKLNRKAD